MPFIEQPLDIWKAAECGRLEEVKQFVSQGLGVDAKSRGNVTPLHLASKKGHLEVVNWLLDNGANINARTKAEPGYPGAETPLYLAVLHVKVDIVKGLLKRGADPNLRSSDSTSALEEAAQLGNLELVRLLVDNGANLNPKSDFSPLYAALCSKHLETANYLVERGARTDFKVLPHSSSLLMMVASWKWLPGVEFLLHLGAEVNEKDDVGHTALHHAVLGFGIRTLTSEKTDWGEKVVVSEKPEDAIPVVQRLLDAGADRTIRDNDGFRAVEWAKKIRAQPLIELLVQSDASDQK
jgi:ankyrin repeat protein